MILTDKDIIRLCDSKPPLIEPFKENNLTPNGYDLSIKELKIQGTTPPYIIPAGSFFVVLTEEIISLPPDIGAKLYLRSSYATRGIMATFGYIDAGFSGRLRLAMYNSSFENIILDPNDLRIVQVVFEELKDIPDKLYKERSGRYQDVLKL